MKFMESHENDNSGNGDEVISYSQQRMRATRLVNVRSQPSAQSGAILGIFPANAQFYANIVRGVSSTDQWARTKLNSGGFGYIWMGNVVIVSEPSMPLPRSDNDVSENIMDDFVEESAPAPLPDKSNESYRADKPRQPTEYKQQNNDFNILCIKPDGSETNVSFEDCRALNGVVYK